MKNFLRALKFAIPYRKRLITSIVFAMLAAALWGMNFTAIYPVLKLLRTEETPQQWIDGEVAAHQKEVDKLQEQANKLEVDQKRVEALPDGKFRDQQIRDNNAAQAKVQGKLESARRSLYHQQIAHKYIHSFVPADCFQTLALVILLVIVCVAIKGVFEFGQESLVGSVVNLSLFDLRNRFYRNAIHLDVEQFNEHGTGEMMARFTNDTELLGTGLKTLFGKVIAEPLRALACVILACWISWQLTLMFLILVPIALFVLNKVGRLMKRATHRLLERMSSIYKILQESFQNIRVVKAFTNEPYERRRFCGATKDYYHKAMQVVNLDAAASPIVEVLGVAAVAGALLAGAYLVLSGETHMLGIRMTNQRLEAETLLQLYALLAAIADPVRKLSSVYTRLQSAWAAADRIFSYYDRQPTVLNNPDSPRLERHHGNIEFRDVCFSYEPSHPILSHINLQVKAGETVALVGKNGCGKTTLVNLLPRFFDPDHGSIFIDGQDIRDVNLRSLRAQVGLVMQDSKLFDDTVYNNIAYANRRASREEVEEAARMASAHEFILHLPNGYNTRVAEMGGRVSGGQRQRIALARAILRNPAILILDEFTSAADPESDLDIHRLLREFKRGRTTFVITHRLNTLEIADRIVVVDQGHIAAVGTHRELLTTCPVYQRLHDAHEQRLVA